MKILVNKMPNVPSECLFCHKVVEKVEREVDDDKLSHRNTVYLCEFRKQECSLGNKKTCRYLKEI